MVLFMFIWLVLPIFLVGYSIHKFNCAKKMSGSDEIERNQKVKIINRIRELYARNAISKEDYNYILYGDKETTSSLANEPLEASSADLDDNSGSLTQKQANYTESPAMLAMKKTMQQNGIVVSSESKPNIINTTYSKDMNIEKTVQIVSDKPKRKLSAVNVLAIIGASFILFAGVLFIVATWSIMPAIVKISILLLFNLSVYGASVFTEKKLKLKSTGTVFYTISLLFTPIIVLSLGYFNIFGTGEELTGSNGSLWGMLVMLTLSIAASRGAKKFSSIEYGYTVMTAFTIAVLFGINALNLRSDVTALIISLFGISAAFIYDRLSKIKNYTFNVYRKISQKFSLISTIVLSVIVLSYSENGVISAIAVLIFGTIFISPNFINQTKSIGVFPFALFLIVGVYKILDPTDKSFATNLFLITVVVMAVLSEVAVFNDVTKKFMRVCTLMLTGCSLLINGYVCVFEPEKWTLISLASVVVFNIGIIWLNRKMKSTIVSSYHTLITLWMIIGISRLCVENLNIYSDANELGLISNEICFMIAVLSTVAWAVYYLTRKMRTASSDFVFPSVIFLMCIILTTYENEFSSVQIIICALLFYTIQTLLAFEKNEKIMNVVSRYAYPLTIGFVFIVICKCVESIELDEICFAYLITIALADTILGVIKFSTKRILELSRIFDVFVTGFGLLFFMINLFDSCPLILAVYGIARVITEFENENSRIRKVYTYFSVAFLLIGIESISSLFITSLVWLALFAVVVFAIKYRGNYAKLLTQYANAVAISSALLTVAMYNDSVSTLMFWMTLLIAIVSFIAQQYINNNLLGIAPIIVVYLLATDLLMSVGADNNMFIFTMLSIQILTSLIGRIYYKRLKSDDCKTHIDWLTISGFIAGIEILINVDSSFSFWICAILYTLGLFKRNESCTFDKSVLTFTMAFSCFAIWNQEIVDIPNLISFELNLLPVVVFFVLLRYLWSDKKKTTEVLSFVSTTFCILLLMFDAMITAKMLDTMIIIGVSLFILGYSIAKKRKKWFILSVGTLIFLTLYMMRPFMNALNWWVYLVIIGTLLIFIAAACEYSKQNKKSFIGGIKEKANEFLHDWKW